jgi:thiamine biosynthesis lipoprotein
VRPALIAALLLAGLLPGCRDNGSSVQKTLNAFGSEVRIEIRGSNRVHADAALAAAAKLLDARDREWHAWRASDLTRINAALRSGSSAQAPPSLLRLVRLSQDYASRSGGLYDPSVGGLVELWGFHTSEYPVRTPAPSLTQVEQWRQRHARMADVRIEGDRIASRNPAVQLDFNAIVEGVAADEIAALFRRNGIRHALISMGGDIYALGDGDGHAWEVGMRDPYGGALGRVELGDGEAFYSSGSYNKFRESANGGRWGHILDPRTGMPARGAAAAAVLHRDPILADVASTSLMVGGPAGFQRLVQQLQLGCALMVTEENELLITAAMQQRMRFLRQPISLGAPLDMGPACSPR